MKLTFLGTRGEIERRTSRHRRHSSPLVAYRGKEVVVDCGVDWLGEVDGLVSDGIVVTHAHPDHVGGLKEGAPCPVYATEEAWRAIKRYGVEERREIEPRLPFAIRDMVFEAFPLEHSLRAPAVGYRITAGRRGVFYAPDVASIGDAREAMVGIDLFIGDGASISQGILRRRNQALIGHASVLSSTGARPKAYSERSSATAGRRSLAVTRGP